MVYYYERRKQHGSMCYLIAEKDVDAFVGELNAIQNAQNVFYNVTVRPYNGKRYDGALFWVCIG